MATEEEPTQPNQSTTTEYSNTVITIIGSFAVLGFSLAGEMDDPGVLIESIWMGMGFAIVYLLLVVASNLKRLKSAP
ncbi:hypothetical protein A6E15_08305 [Natrinema saccharevitans]|uniref:Uncharacterized protein n=1 Tax=Natrinema saccharevitans TaxID=301967 RepID=A0A1S8AWE6_9EURY|nr:hypothetical protein [Natrinema saccharevitans]OLZ40992.1 hypothetical protein A6E15_08305 [Natrinema saccharevitans]